MSTAATPQVHELRQAVKPRVRGLAPWSPQQATRDLLDRVRRVLIEYGAYLPLTLRQVFYRLVGAHGYDKTEQAYDRLGEMMNRARRAGFIPFEHIRDDGADVRVSIDWDSVHELLAVWRYHADQFRLDRQQGQKRRLVVMVEAAGMRPQIEAAVDGYSVPVIPSGGFDSLTAKHDLAQAIGALDGTTEVLHIGDHDPSGGHLFLSMGEDVQALIHDLGLAGTVAFTRLAVTPTQVVALNLPTAPPKVTDRRAFDGETVQAEAIPPDELARIVTGAVQARIDPVARRRVLRREQRCRDWLQGQLRGIDAEDAP
jgi:hypothetical protein